MKRFLLYATLFTLLIGAIAWRVGQQMDDTLDLMLRARANELSDLRAKAQTLDLAIEFGFDPLVVQTVQRLSVKEFCAKHAPITWRFVKTDKELAYLVLSMIQIESHGEITAYNKSGASGLTQMLLSTARQYDKNVKSVDLLVMPKNLELAMTSFVSLLEHYRGNHYLAILAWNRGITGADRILTAGIGSDAYVTSVFEQAALRNAK